MVEAVEQDHRLNLSWEFPDEPPSRVSMLGGSVTAGPAREGRGAGEGRSGARLLHLHHSDLGDLTTTYLPGWITRLTYFEATLERTPLPPQAFWRLYATHDLLTTQT